MNLSKKLIIFILPFLFFSKSMGMHRNSLDDLSERPCPLGKIIDYFVQLGTVMSLNTDKPVLIKSLAGLRIFMNSIQILQRISWSWIDNRLSAAPKTMVKALYRSDLSKIVKMGIAGIRARNICLDCKVLKFSKKVAENKLKDNMLRKKQWMQALWLTGNKAIPFIIDVIIEGIREHGDRTAYYGSVYPFLAEISELYRQNVVYSMMLEKKSC